MTISDFEAVFITWTTYGTWLPGDARGWRHRRCGHGVPKPLLEEWVRSQMTGQAVLLSPQHRKTTALACRNHCDHRGWELLAANARTNHVHVVVAADIEPKTIRDQLKANCTRELRNADMPLNVPRTWTRGGDCEVLFTDEDVEAVVLYVKDGQDRHHHDHTPEP